MTQQTKKDANRRPPSGTDIGDRPAKVKRPYKAPVLVVWGTLAQMTQTVGNRGNKDGARKPYNRTH
jgi:hypothetical protein